jgi:hypothetical protein
MKNNNEAHETYQLELVGLGMLFYPQMQASTTSTALSSIKEKLI